MHYYSHVSQCWTELGPPQDQCKGTIHKSQFSFNCTSRASQLNTGMLLGYFTITNSYPFSFPAWGTKLKFGY